MATSSVLHVPGPLRNHIRPSVVNQASSDSVLARRQTKQMLGSQTSLVQDTLSKKESDRDGVGGSSSRGLLLPSVQNMKTNVSEKVAQVGVVRLFVFLLVWAWSELP